MYERPGPSFVSVLFAVYVAGGIASLVTNQVTARALLGAATQPISRSDAVHLFFAAQLLNSLVVTFVGAGIVCVILGIDGEGPSFARALAGVALGSVIGSVVSLYVALNMRPPVGPAQGAPFVNVLQSVAYAPLMFVGLFVSALVIHAGTGMMRTRPGETPWEYKLPPGTTWRD